MIEYLKCQESELGGRGSHGGLLAGVRLGSQRWSSSGEAKREWSCGQEAEGTIDIGRSGRY